MGLALRPLTAISYLELCRNVEGEENAVSRFRKSSHTIMHCQYHIIWVPKYGYRVLVGPIQEAACTGIRAICGYVGCEVVELNVQRDHVDLILMIQPKVAISDLMGRVKGQTSIKLFKRNGWKSSLQSPIRERPKAAQPRPASFGGWPCPLCGGWI